MVFQFKKQLMETSKKNKLYRILFTVGILFFYVGILDPMEGSVVISCGIVLITLTSYLRKDPKAYLFLIAMIAVITGVIALFVVSSFGGLGKDALSPWWGLSFLPYPLGWIFGTLVLILKYWKKQSYSQPQP